MSELTDGQNLVEICGNLCVVGLIGVGILGGLARAKWTKLRMEWHTEGGHGHKDGLKWSWFWGPLWILGVVKPGHYKKMTGDGNRGKWN